MTQLAFLWGEEEHLTDYSTVTIKLSKHALSKKLEEGQGYFCGMARGSGVGHIIDKLNLRFNMYN